MQRSTRFLLALFVGAVCASAAIKLNFFAKVPIELGRSARGDAARASGSGQVGAEGSTGVSLAATQNGAGNRGSAIEASTTVQGDAGTRPLPADAMRQRDLEIRATSHASLVVRYKAAQALSDFASSGAVQTLSKVLLTDQSPRVRLASAQSLVEIARGNPDLAAEVRAALQAVVSDSNGNVSVAARQALSEIQ